MARLAHKRGDTLSVYADYTADAVAVNLTGYTVTAMVRKRNATDTTPYTLTCTLANQGTSPGRVTLSATAAETALWVVGEYVCDIQYVSGGGAVTSTETFDFSVLEDITHA